MESYELQPVLDDGAFAQMTVPVPLAANMLGIDPFAVGRLIADSELECVQRGQYRFIPLPALFAYRRRARLDEQAPAAEAVLDDTTALDAAADLLAG